MMTKLHVHYKAIKFKAIMQLLIDQLTIYF